MEMMEMSHWQKVAVLVQAEFQEGRLAEEATRQAVVLIPEGGGDYHGIDLVEVVRKVVTLIINRCFTTPYPSTTSSMVSGRVASQVPLLLRPK